MNNNDFLSTISKSFVKFLTTHSRSNKKLVVLHSAIANDLKGKLGEEYSITALGIGDGKELKIQGRYINKSVDICIHNKEKVVAGIAVKFVMQNYSQNSNNYFENMLGETANIQGNRIPYFQIFIIPDYIPYYNKDGVIKKWEKINEHNVKKYIILSKDNVEESLHTPKKTLLYVVKLPDIDPKIEDKEGYKAYYLGLDSLDVFESNNVFDEFDSAVIYNDYPLFIDKVVHYIKAL